MKIYILTQYYFPEMGAPQARLYELSNYLKEQNHEVEIITAMPNYPLGKIFRNYGRFYMKDIVNDIVVHRAYIYPTNSLKFLIRIWNYFSFVISSLLIGVIKIKKADIIFVESPPLFLGLSAYLLSKIKNAKLIFNVSDLWPESAIALGVIKKGFMYKIAIILEEFLYKNSWLITGQSNEIVQNIISRFKSLDVIKLSNGVDVKKYNLYKKNNFLDKWTNANKIKGV